MCIDYNEYEDNIIDKNYSGDVHAEFDSEMYTVYGVKNNIVATCCTYEDLHNICNEQGWNLISCTGLD